VNGLMMDRPLQLTTLLWRAETIFGDNEIVVGHADGGSSRYTYREYGERVRRLAAALTSLGARAGDRVGTLAWNSHRHLEAYYAVPCGGLVLHTINLRFSDAHLVHSINHARDRILLVDADQLPRIEAIWERLSSVEVLVVLGEGDTSIEHVSYEQVLADVEPVSRFADVDERSAAGICFTSATTGDPKAVVYSHRSMVLHSLAASLHGSFGVREDMTLLSISPMFHANSWGLPHAAVMQGTTLVLPGVHPDAARYLTLIEQERVTHAYGAVTVGIQIRDLLERDPGRFDISSLEVLLLGGQAPPRELARFFKARGVQVPQAWGMTEASPLVSWNYVRPRLRSSPEREDEIESRQGVPLPLIELAVADETGQTIGDSSSNGELLVRGPWVAREYLDDPARSAAMTGGWFHTGDLGRLDEDGYVRVLDRAKDLIKSGGEWISSLELEDALAEHPGVAEAAVVGVPDRRWLERPVAYIVARDTGAIPDHDELVAHLMPRFPKFWLPDEFRVVAEIPKTGVGKYDKRALRESHSS